LSKREIEHEIEDTVFSVEPKEPVSLPQRLAYIVVVGHLRFDRRTREWFRYRSQTQLLFATASDTDLRQAAEHIIVSYLGSPTDTTRIIYMTEKLEEIRAHALSTGVDKRYLVKATLNGKRE